jgi:hypothetical protein
VAVRCKASVCSRLVSGIAVSNSAESMVVSVVYLCVCVCVCVCVAFCVKYRPQRSDDGSFSGVLIVVFV